MIHIKLFEDFIEEKHWKLTIDLSKEWAEKEEKDELSPEEFKDMKSKVVAVLKTYQDEIQKVFGDSEAMKYEDFVEYMQNSDDEEEWDSNFNDLYDWADDNDVWIKSIV
jgi:hypothetical protein